MEYQIPKFKKINCAQCNAPCNSGKKGLCDRHYADYLAKRKKERDAKKLVTKPPKEVVFLTDKMTDLKLDTIFAKAVKHYYPQFCHSCGTPVVLGSKDTHACHLIDRHWHAVRWDIRNVYTGCSACNLFDPDHQHNLAVWADKYFGWGTYAELLDLSKKTFQWSQPARRELYELFKSFLAYETSKEEFLEKYLTIKNLN